MVICFSTKLLFSNAKYDHKLFLTSNLHNSDNYRIFATNHWLIVLKGQHAHIGMMTSAEAAGETFEENISNSIS